MTRGLVIAAPASGSGKTVFTLGLLRHLAAAGRAVASCKAGPDYIDPAFHAAASGRPCRNLDIWAMRRETLDAEISAAGREAELVICEGVMGLFDGAGVGEGSTADLAAYAGWPVILVVDVRAQAASAAALVRGFASHRADVRVAGVVFNRTGGEGHERVLREACAAALPELPILGCLRRDPALALPERHLGLVLAEERQDLDGMLDAAAHAIARQVEVERLLALAGPGRAAGAAGDFAPPPLPPLGQRIAVARDRAFAFVYDAVLEGWRAAGAELEPFSPLAGEAPQAQADAVYLPGGYPELHAGRLASGPFLAGLRAAARRGALIFGECGGYMVLGQGLVDAQGARHEMAGLLPLETSFAEPRLHLGYREARPAPGTILGESAASYRGHEFHYATTLKEGPGEALFDCADAQGRKLGKTGLIDGRIMGSFVHLIDRRAG